jgi:hypothetical protein
MQLRTPLALLTLSLTTAHAELISLRQHWDQGKTYTLQTTTETVVKQVSDSNMSVTQTTELKAAKAANKKGSTQLKVKFLSTKASITGNGKTATYDSSDELSSDTALVGSLGSAVGQTFSLVYDEKDRFKDVKDLQTMATEPGAAPGLLAVEESKRVATVFAKSIEMGLPAMPVEVGSTWTADEVLSLANIGEVHADITGKLEKIEILADSRMATITLDGTLRSTKAGVAKAPNAMELSTGSTIHGTLLFDLDQRIITEFKGTTELQLKANDQPLTFEMKETRRMLAIQPTAKQ